jgi:putative transposase
MISAKIEAGVSMKKSKFSDSQIVSILNEVESGMKVADVCRKHGISNQTYYTWKSKFGGMGVSDIKRLKELEDENAKLKKMFADMALENNALKDLIDKKL